MKECDLNQILAQADAYERAQERISDLTAQLQDRELTIKRLEEEIEAAEARQGIPFWINEAKSWVDEAKNWRDIAKSYVQTANEYHRKLCEYQEEIAKLKDDLQFMASKEDIAKLKDDLQFMAGKYSREKQMREAAEAREAELREALLKIRDHPSCYARGSGAEKYIAIVPKEITDIAQAVLSRTGRPEPRHLVDIKAEP